MKILLIVGAGTSVELGVPTMAGLAEQFKEHAEQWRIEPDLVRKIMGDTLDIEHLIERLDQICTARDSFESVGQKPDFFDRADALRAEVEWFVQHAAERVIPREAQLLWGPILRANSDIELTVASTNYDRAIELAANAEGIAIEDGYTSFEDAETARWRGFMNDGNRIQLVKLHGSTDWYIERLSGEPKKLRHPMPLFGRAELKMPTGLELGSALILPSREKLLTRDPYPRLTQAFLNAADSCDMAIVIGSSLRDYHIRGAVKSIASRVPVFIVNRKGSLFNLDQVLGIRQTASVFLTGTLPIAIKNSDPALALRDASKMSVPQPINCLHPLAIAIDDDNDTARCAALDTLEAAEIPLDEGWLRALIQDPSSEVARYSLGFLTQVPNAEALLEVARSCPHAKDGSPFQEDLRLLEYMLEERKNTSAANKTVQTNVSGDS